LVLGEKYTEEVLESEDIKVESFIEKGKVTMNISWGNKAKL